MFLLLMPSDELQVFYSPASFNSASIAGQASSKLSSC